MKLFYLSLFVTFALVYDLKAQKTQTITYDFSQQQFTNNTKDLYKDGDLIKVEVININRFIYDVSISISNQNLVSNPRVVVGQILENLSSFSTPQKKPQVILTNREEPSSICTRAFNKLEEINKIENELFELSNSIKVANISSLQIQNLIDYNDEDKINEGFEVINDLERIFNENSADSCIQGIKKDFETKKYEEQLRKYTDLFTNVMASSFQSSTNTVNIDGDNIQVSINITPKDLDWVKKLPTENYTLVQNFPVWSKKWKLSFSGGFYGDFLNTEVSQFNYQPVAVNDSLIKYQMLEEGDISQWNIGISSLAHFMTNVSQKTKTGFFIGAAVPLNRVQNLRLSLGPCIAFGRKNQVVFNLGLAAGYRNVPSSNIDSSFLFASTDFSIPNVSKIVCSTFLSLTFNVFELK